ncbi:MAG: hypothetical protein AAF488_09635 [Planctomycetota bacterium]
MSLTSVVWVITGFVTMGWWSIRGLLTLGPEWRQRCWGLFVLAWVMAAPMVIPTLHSLMPDRPCAPCRAQPDLRAEWIPGLKGEFDDESQ